MLLEKIAKENDIKKIKKEDYTALAEEIRSEEHTSELQSH